MAGLSDYLANKILLDYLGAGKVVYLGFNLGDPEDGVTATEPVGGAYARVVATSKWTIVNNQAVNNADLLSPEATALWGDVSWITLWTALTGGSLLFSGPVVATKTIDIGDVARVKSGQLTVTTL